MGSAPDWRLVFRASALLALIAGLLLFAGATRTDDYFSWTIEPAQTAAFTAPLPAGGQHLLVIKPG